MDISDQDLEYAKKKWKLLDDGAVFKTHSGLLQPVIYGGNRAILKIPFSREEHRSIHLMICWDGNGAAKVFKHDKQALLLERAIGAKSLKEMVIKGNEDEANRIVCDVAARLHAARCGHVPQLVPLDVWFSTLKPAADQYGGIFVKCNEVANELLNAPLDTVALHGDIHYENILDSGTRGWFAIDPKGLFGERGFDFANIFCNPTVEIAASPHRLSKQVKIIAEEAGLDPKRLLNWIIAWAGLSAAFCLEDGEDARLPLTVAEIAVSELD
jgi:streptomycin 6-kinase